MKTAEAHTDMEHGQPNHGIYVAVRGGWSNRVDGTIEKDLQEQQATRKAESGFIKDKRGWGRYLALVLQGDDRERILLIGIYAPVKSSTGMDSVIGDYNWQQQKLRQLINQYRGGRHRRT